MGSSYEDWTATGARRKPKSWISEAGSMKVCFKSNDGVLVKDGPPRKSDSWKGAPLRSPFIRYTPWRIPALLREWLAGPVPAN